MQNDMASGINDDWARHKFSSVNNQRALSSHSLSKLASFSHAHVLVRWSLFIGLLICSRLEDEVWSLIHGMLGFWLLQTQRKLSSMTSRVLFLKLHVKGLDAHATTCGELLLDGVGWLGLGVGAPCLGGGLPSLSPSLFYVLAHDMARQLGFALSLHGVVLGFQPSLIV